MAQQNQARQAQEKIVSVLLDQAIQSPLPVQVAQAQLANAQQATQAAYKDQAVQAQQAKKYLAPTQLPAWHLMSENHRANALKNEAIAISNAAIFVRNIKQAEAHQAAAAGERGCRNKYSCRYYYI